MGGRENIATVSHCITRLRFVLNDPAKANPKAIEALSMVKGCFTNAGQFRWLLVPKWAITIRLCSPLPGTTRQIKSRPKGRAPEYEMARAAYLPLRRDLLPTAAGADQRGLILGFRNVIGDVPMSDGKTGADVPGAENYLRLPVADWRSDLLLSAGGDLLVRRT